MVWNWVCGAFVVSEEDERPVHELFVRKERSEEGLRPIGCVLETCVMPIIQHIGGEVGVLREGVGLDI
jgi:hypothetical protein